jgi:hypothetical protein
MNYRLRYLSKIKAFCGVVAAAATLESLSPLAPSPASAQAPTTVNLNVRGVAPASITGFKLTASCFTAAGTAITPVVLNFPTTTTTSSLAVSGADRCTFLAAVVGTNSAQLFQQNFQGLNLAGNAFESDLTGTKLFSLKREVYLDYFFYTYMTVELASDSLPVGAPITASLSCDGSSPQTFSLLPGSANRFVKIVYSGSCFVYQTSPAAGTVT